MLLAVLFVANNLVHKLYPCNDYFKAEASRDYGATLLLVPLLQSREVIYETSESCEEFGSNEICTPETKPRRVNLTEETGIEIQEVENISEAIKYFFD